MTTGPEDAEWRRSRRRRTLAWLGAGLLVTCLVGSVAGYIWYDRATRIDRSTPVVVVEQYIYTIFDDRDLAGAEELECRGGSRQNILSLLTDIERLERTYDILVTVSTANYSTTIVATTRTWRSRFASTFRRKTGNRHDPRSTGCFNSGTTTDGGCATPGAWIDPRGPDGQPTATDTHPRGK